MTVSTEISSNEYTGNGVTTDFDYKFRIFKANQLSVISSDADGDNVVTLRLGTDYTVTGANKSTGGKVILTRPLANGHKISIARDIPITQETSFRNQGKFLAETHEDAFDYLTMIIQRIWGSLGSLYLKRPNILANWFDAKGYRIANLGKPKRDSDAVDLGTLKDEISGVNSTILKREKRLLRVDDMDISALPKASERSNKQIGFDSLGIPTLLDPAETGALGYILVDSFEKGALITGRYQALHFEYQGEFYRWDGGLPKQVPAGSTPQSTGGIGKGAWVSVGDASLRPLVNKKQGIYSISLLENGGVADKTTDNTQLIQNLIDSSENAFLMIEKDCKWDSSLIDFKDNVNVIDYSGWDNKYKNWTAQVKMYLDTDNPQTKNANEYIILSRHHPALILDNYGDENDPEGEEHRASVILRSQGVSKARVGIGATGTDTNFVITDADLSARFAFKNTAEGDYELSLNSQPVNGVDYAYGSKADKEQTHRKIARTGFGVSEQYYSGSNNQLVRINYNTDGSIRYSQLGAVTLNISSSGAVHGQKKRILKETSYSLAASDSGTICANVSSGSSSTYTLPVGVYGVFYTLVNTSGTNLSANTRAGESFIDGSTSKTINTRGSNITCLCIGEGSWVIY